MAEGFIDWSAGQVLTAANLEDYTVRQSLMRFDDATARDAALTGGIVTEGMVAYLKDVNKFTVYSGAAWIDYGRLTSTETWTPTIAQGVSSNITKTVNEARHLRLGNLVWFWVDLALTAAGTAASAVTITLPVTAVGHSSAGQFGQAMYYDASQAANLQRAVGAFEFVSSTVIALAVTNPEQSGLWGQTPSLAAASGDIIRGSGTFTVA